METKPCSHCGKKMIRVYDSIVLASYPPQYPWKWKCGCGHSETGGVEIGKTSHELFLEKWNRANAVKEH